MQNIERMKQLARSDDGLNAFINTIVRKAYPSKSGSNMVGVQQGIQPDDPAFGRVAAEPGR
jgi:hypothetical protein